MIRFIVLQESGTIVFGRNIKFFPSVSMVIFLVKQRDEDYIISINDLKDKHFSSGFDKKKTQTMIEKVSTWTEIFGLTNQKKHTEKSPIGWATSFPQLLKLTDKECVHLNKELII